jgi:hypothetical protein
VICFQGNIKPESGVKQDQYSTEEGNHILEEVNERGWQPSRNQGMDVRRMK